MGIENKIIAIVKEYTELEEVEINSNTSFSDIEIDSIDMTEIIFDIEESFNINIIENDHLKDASYNNINDITKLVSDIINESNSR